MKFVYFTDIHLSSSPDAIPGFEKCLDSILSHDPEILINGGDLGITPESVSLYQDITRDLSVPIMMCNGNHEMCSGFLPRDQAGTVHTSKDVDGVHFVILDVVRYFEPTETHPQNWYGLCDSAMLEWLEEDLSKVPHNTTVFMICHIPVSTTFQIRMGQMVDLEFPTNEIANAGRLRNLLKPFDHVATLHGHDHENCRHYVDQIEVMTTAAVAGNWWRNGLDSRAHGREPQGYRLVEVSEDGEISSRYIAFVSDQDEPAECYLQDESGRRFINVFDASPSTRVTVEGLGDLPVIDPRSEAARGLSTHLYELPEGFDRMKVATEIAFEDGRTLDLVLVNG